MLSNGDEYAGSWVKDIRAVVTPPPRQRKRANQYASLPLYSANLRSLRLRCPTFFACARVQPRSAAADRRNRKSGVSAALGCEPPGPSRRSMLSEVPHARLPVRNRRCLGSYTLRWEQQHPEQSSVRVGLWPRRRPAPHLHIPTSRTFRFESHLIDID